MCPHAQPSRLERALGHIDLLAAAGGGQSTLLDALCDFIFQSLRGVIPFDRLAVALLEGAPPVVRVRWQRSISPGPAPPGDYALPLSRTSLGGVARRQRPRILTDLEAYLREHPDSPSTRVMVRHGVRSSLTCPLVVRGNTVGFVFFSSRQPGTYRGAHMAVFERVAHDLAIVVEHAGKEAGLSPAAAARLGATLEGLAKAASDGQQEALLIGRITDRINAGKGLAQILDFVYQEFQELLPYDRIDFALVDEPGQRVRACWGRSDGGPNHLDMGFSQPLHQGALGSVMRQARPRVLNDLEAYVRDHPTAEATRRIVAEGHRSSLTCPLLAMGQPVGFLFFSSRQTGAYRDAHVERFQRVADRLAVILEKARLYEQLEAERRRNDALLRDLMPDSIVDALQRGDLPPPALHPAATVLLADLVGFTHRCANTPPIAVQQSLHALFQAFDAITGACGLTKISTIGDAYLAVAGVPEPVDDHWDRSVRAAVAMHDAAQILRWPDGPPMQVRIGLSCGPVVSGLVGRTARRYDIWGHTVNMAARLQAEAESGTTLASGCHGQDPPAGFVGVPIGSRTLKGIGEVPVWRVGRECSEG